VKGEKVEQVNSNRCSESVLVVEDSHDLRELMSEILRLNGYTVIHACDGEEGYALFNSDSYNISLVVSDVLMPKLSGRQLRDRIREKRPDVKFLFVSGYAAQDSNEGLIAEPDVDFVQKPFTISDFSAKVREILDRK